MKGLRFLVLVSRFGFEFDFWPWDVIGPPEPVDRDLIFKIKLPKFVDFELLVNYSEAISRPFDRPLKSNIYCFLEINLPPRKKGMKTYAFFSRTTAQKNKLIRSQSVELLEFFDFLGKKNHDLS